MIGQALLQHRRTARGHAMSFTPSRHLASAGTPVNHYYYYAMSCCFMQAAAFERIKSGCLAPFPRAQYALVSVQPFGSYANGLSLAASDIDVVITGVAYPDDGRGGGLLICYLFLFGGKDLLMTYDKLKQPFMSTLCCIRLHYLPALLASSLPCTLSCHADFNRYGDEALL